MKEATNDTGVLPSQQGQERVITMRLSRELHADLKAEAAAKNTSLNQLCVELCRNGIKKNE